MRDKKQIGPWRAAFNWHMSVFLLGSFVATVATLPILIPLVAIYGDHPFKGMSEWIILRLTQMFQSVIIASAGGALTLRYFRRNLPITYEQMRVPMIVMGGCIAVCPVLLAAGIGLWRYGPTLPMILTAMLILGVFIVCFLAGSFHFAKKLTTVANQALHATSEPAPSAASSSREG